MSVIKPRTDSTPQASSKTTSTPTVPRRRTTAPPPQDQDPTNILLKPLHIKLIVLTFALSFLYKTLSLRIPYLFSPTASPSTNASSCKRYHPNILLNCEDFRPLPTSPSSVLLTCDPSRRQWQPHTSTFPEHTPPGSLYLWNTETPELRPIAIEVPQAGDDFHPLGLSTIALSAEEAGKGGFDTRVFVVDQARSQPQVHIFDLNPSNGETRPIRVIRHARMNSPNGVVAENSTSFFVSNDGYFSRKSAVGLVLEALSGWPLSEVLRVNFGVESLDIRGRPSVHIVAKVGLGNGVEYDRERRTLWVASMTHGLYSFLLPKEREAYPLSVKGPWTRFFRTSMVPDNLFLSGRTLYIAQVGSIVKTLKSLSAKDAESAPKVPSWVVSLELPPAVLESTATTDVEILGEDRSWWERKEGLYANGKSNGGLRKEEARFREVFEDDGGVYGSVSTGGVVQQGMFMAVGLVESGVLVCENI